MQERNVYYYLQKKPNWSEVLKDKKGKIFSIRKY